MATIKQLLRILCLSLLLNLVHISISLQINPLHQSDVGYFHPDFPDVHGRGPVFTDNGDLVHYDIYRWVEKLKGLADTHGTEAVAEVIQLCLRGSAATLWIIELTDEERKELRKANLQRWSSVLIDRFTLLPFIAVSKLVTSEYSWRELYQPLRIWIRQMVLNMTAAGIDSTFSQLFIIWNSMHPNLSADIPMPDETTEFVDFLEEVEEMYPAWVLWNHESHVNTLKHAFQLYDIKRSPYEEMLVAKTSVARRQADIMRKYTPQEAERIRQVAPRLYLAIFFSRYD